MANQFLPIDQFTLKSTLTGNEEFQVSATEKVKATQIANKVQLSNVLMGGFQALDIKGVTPITDRSSLLGAMKILYQLVGNANIKLVGNLGSIFGMVATGVNNALMGYGILFDISGDTPTIYFRDGFTDPNPLTLSDGGWITAIKNGKSISLKEGGGLGIMEVGDFTTINEVWAGAQVPGSMCAFYTGSEVYSAPEVGETDYVGFVILDNDFSTSSQATVVAYAKGSGRQYIGKLQYASQSIDWFPNVNAPVTITDFKSVPMTVKAGRDGELFPIIVPVSAANGPAGLSSAGPGYGYVQVTKVGSTKAYNYMVQLDGSGSPQLYSGFCHTTANTISWTPVGGPSNVLHGENVEEGLEYLIPKNVGDVVAFRSTADSAQVPATQEGFGFLAKVNGSESIALLVQNDPSNPNAGKKKIFTGLVQNDGSGTEWSEVSASSSASSGGVFGGFHNIMANNYKYVETLNQSDFSILLNKTYNFNTELEDRKLYLDMELVSGTPYYYTAAPLPIEIVTIQNHWLADNVVVYSALLNTPTNGKIQLILTAPSNPSVISTLDFTVIGSSLSGALKINGIYIK